MNTMLVLLSALARVLPLTGEAGKTGTTNNNVDLGLLAIFPVSNSSAVLAGKRQFSHLAVAQAARLCKYMRQVTDSDQTTD